MKLKVIILISAIAILGCKEHTTEVQEKKEIAIEELIPQKEDLLQQAIYESYGEKITSHNLTDLSVVKEKYASLAKGDSVQIKFKAPIESVCKSKGCWMRLTVGEEEEIYVKFKDYGFFVPTDASGEVIVKGKAFVEETSVVEQQHLALDAGMSADDIAAITEHKRELKLLAEGVSLKK